MIENAPIAIFVYNRPEHTRQMLDALSKNDEVGESTIYVFGDGPKIGCSQEELNAIGTVRSIVQKIDFACKVVVNFQDSNVGLAKSIITGVSHVLCLHDNVIVLEDDLVVSRSFLRFMNNALTTYRNESQVMHVSGYLPDLRLEHNEDVALMRLTQSWGWGTWQTAWDNFNPNAMDLVKKVERSGRKRYFNYDGTYRFFKMLKRTAAGRRDSWAIRWYASVFLNDGLALNATRSLVRNIGHDSSGTHSYSTRSFDNLVTDETLNVNKLPTAENMELRKALRNFYLRQKLSDGFPYYVQQIRKKLGL